MRCKNCDTEIDAKALICFRCGTATTDPVHQPYKEPASARPLAPLLLSGVFLATVGFFAFRAFQAAETHPAVWGLLAAAGVLLVLRLKYR